MKKRIALALAALLMIVGLALPAAAETMEGTEAPSAPAIIKHPYSEVVYEGEQTWFIARADVYEWCAWQFIGPNGEEVVFDKITDYFPGVEINGGNAEVIRVTNIPVEMDGWQVKCLFVGADHQITYSDTASITVKDVARFTDGAQTPAPEPELEPETEPAAAPVTEPAPEEETTPVTQPQAQLPTEAPEAPATEPWTEPAPAPEPEEAPAPAAWWVIALVAVLAAAVGYLIVTLKRMADLKRLAEISGEPVRWGK